MGKKLHPMQFHVAEVESGECAKHCRFGRIHKLIGCDEFCQVKVHLNFQKVMEAGL